MYLTSCGASNLSIVKKGTIDKDTLTLFVHIDDHYYLISVHIKKSRTAISLAG